MTATTATTLKIIKKNLAARRKDPLIHHTSNNSLQTLLIMYSHLQARHLPLGTTDRIGAHLFKNIYNKIYILFLIFILLLSYFFFYFVFL